MRRTLALVALAALGLVLVVVIRAPLAPEARRAHGVRVVRVPKATVRSVELVIRDRRLVARHTAPGWEVDGAPADPPLAAALDDLLQNLVDLRAVDAFRPEDHGSYGLEPEHGSIVLATDAGQIRLLLGDVNAAGSAVYARRSGDPRVFQIGTGFLTTLDRVFYRREAG